MKRRCTFVGIILSLVAYAILCASTVYALIVAIMISAGTIGEGTISGVTTGGIVLFSCVILLIAYIALIVNTSRMLKYYKGSAEEWKKGRNRTVTLTVFAILLGLISIWGFTSILDFILGGMLIASGVLYIVDLSLENKRIAKLNASEASTENTNSENTTAEDTAPVEENKPSQDTEDKE